MSCKNPLQLPFGAVYFRKTNPPKEDWARDYDRAAKDGMNVFRHWFMWGSIEVAPGVYDWEDYDRQMELAEKNGIKTIIAEFDTSIPEWLAFDHPDLLCQHPDGRKSETTMGMSCATGGFYAGVCLDNPLGRQACGSFITALAKRYKGHPALLGYDIWNECDYSHNLCYCEHTRRAYRAWLQAKYGSLEGLMAVWRRNSYTRWDQVNPPVQLGLFPDSMDWLRFRRENAYTNMKWRSDVIREVDADCLMTAHGTAASITNMPMGGSDDWSAAAAVESYGFTWVASRKGTEPWKQWHAADLVRAGSRGKRFWHAEMQGGPLWLQPQLTGRPRLDGRISRAEDVRIWDLTSLACGARGILYVRWRSLLNGPLFGAFGPYGNDGLPTPRSEMASQIAKWGNAPAQKALIEALPVRGDVGIVFSPECAEASCLLSQWGSEDLFASMLWGAYRGFFDAGLQADFVHIDDIDAYKVLYFAYPVCLTQAQADKLAAWVKAGGTLVCEALPGYFNERLAVAPVQPGLGLGELFGVRETNVELMPDIFEDIPFELDGKEMHGCAYVQTYRALDGAAVAGSCEGEAIAVRNATGQGRTLLLGSYPSRRYYKHSDESLKSFFAGIPAMAGSAPVLQTNVHRGDVHARLHQGGGRSFLWVLNTGGEAGEVSVAMAKPFKTGAVHWGGQTFTNQNGALQAQIPPMDALILEIMPE